ncbi:carbohydrate ABC transporter permease [Schumannella luteola]|uniref:N-acetylglucosamine transport system permease protein n=1 Tax=Schumannella luteola TaxID=472059 RepID=A0A852YHX4_9MICO|nr:carbohydrate ABC transporter permease [Schumannella luteola]NYG99497.1 N-acetylglucosamine transport system permease protein [Schumannella luteola]TPX03822.1 carbohydrate ABC transporter permease [Schumannella luteola]
MSAESLSRPVVSGRTKAARSAKSTPPTDRVPAVIWHIILIIWAAIVVLPLLWTLMTSFKTTKEIFASPFALPGGLDFSNYVKAWNTAGIGSAMVQTVIVVGSALVLVMVLGAMCAYILARFDFPGNRIIYYLMMAGLTFPIFLAIVPLFFTLKGFGLLGTTPGLILTYVAFALPFTVFFLYSFFRTLPTEIAEAAAMDGASEWRTFFQVMLPMARPGLASVAIFNFLGLWNQYLIPTAINSSGTPVLSQAMDLFNSAAGYDVDFGALFAGVVITVLPVLIVYVIFQRQLQGSVSQGTMK